MTTTSANSSITIDTSLIFRWMVQHFFDILLVLVFVYIWQSRDISLSFQFNDLGLTDPEIKERVGEPGPAVMPTAFNQATVQNPPEVENRKKQDLKANHFRNLTFILNPGYAKRKGIDPEVIEAKLNTCKNYVIQYAGFAVREMKRTGIPASITLAQGLLESDAGESRLSLESNNHFGIKCRSKCRGCTCRNYTDDDIYDMFRVFENPMDSFKAHSQLLTSKRYQHLLRLRKTDYKAWAIGLKKAGYATDKKYAEKLITIIENLKLYHYDRQA